MLWVPALLAAAGLAAYWRSFTVPFQFDDLENIVQASRVHLTRLDGQSLWAMLSHYRPLAQLSFGLNYWLGGLAPAGWHAVNLTVHVGAAVVVWLLGGEVLARMGWEAGARRGRAALVTALVFLLHPVQTQAVTYVVQRMASLAAFFALLAAWLWFRGRRSPRPRRWLGGALAAWLAALLTKENTVLLPGILAGAELLFSAEVSVWIRRHRAHVAGGALAAAALGAALLARYWSYIESAQASFGYSTAERLLTQPRVVWHYLSLLLWPLPSRLRVDYSFAPSLGLLDPPTTLFAIAGLALLVGFAWWSRRRRPLVAFAVLWFLGNLAMENSVFPVDLVFEHRLYLPSFGVFLLVAAELELALGFRPQRVWAAAIPALVALGVGTDRRNQTWNDPVALRAQVLADAPDNPRAHLALGNQAMAAGDLEKAEHHYREILETAPAHPWALANLGSVARARGDLAQAERWFREALAVADLEPVPLEGLGVVLSEQGRSAEAEALFQKLLELDSRNARALANMGVLRARQQDRVGASDWLARAVAADPSNAYAHLSRARVLLAFGEATDALSSAQRAAALEPLNPEALELTAECLERLQKRKEAVAAWQQLLAARPSHPLIHFRLGTALALAGDLAGAERELEAQLALGPHSGALNNLGNVWLQRDRARARAYFERALQVDPSNQLAADNLRRLGAAPR